MKNVVQLEQKAAGPVHLFTLISITTQATEEDLRLAGSEICPKRQTQESVFFARMTINARPRKITTLKMQAMEKGW